MTKPPFREGDIITYNRRLWGDYRYCMPGGAPIVALQEDARRNSRLDSGWALFGVDSARFRLATVEDVDKAIDDLLGQMADVQRQIVGLESLKLRLI